MIGRGVAWCTLGVVAVLVLRRHLDVVEVRGRSMAPALVPGDRLLVARFGSPSVGDVVLAADPRDSRRELVKRVSALDRGGGVTLRGDNRSQSTDARTFGAIPRAAVRWRAIGRYWPVDRIGRISPAPALEPIDQGGESACTFPQALIAGEPSIVG
jgi:nickel-type superoxide dismutase maturation protease